MYIKEANTFDRAAICKLVGTVMDEHSLNLDLANRDNDLEDLNFYFNHGGKCLIAVDDGKVVGLAAGRPEENGQFELVRLCVAKPARGKKLAKKLLSEIIAFAKRKGFEYLVVEPSRQKYATGANILTHCGFTFTSDPIEDAQPVWYLDIRQSALSKAS